MSDIPEPPDKYGLISGSWPPVSESAYRETAEVWKHEHAPNHAAAGAQAGRDSAQAGEQWRGRAGEAYAKLLADARAEFERHAATAEYVAGGMTDAAAAISTTKADITEEVEEFTTRIDAAKAAEAGKKTPPDGESSTALVAAGRQTIAELKTQLDGKLDAIGARIRAGEAPPQGGRYTPAPPAPPPTSAVWRNVDAVPSSVLKGQEDRYDHHHLPDTGLVDPRTGEAVQPTPVQHPAPPPTAGLGQAGQLSSPFGQMPQSLGQLNPLSGTAGTAGLSGNPGTAGLGGNAGTAGLGGNAGTGIGGNGLGGTAGLNGNSGAGGYGAMPATMPGPGSGSAAAPSTPSTPSTPATPVAPTAPTPLTGPPVDPKAVLGAQTMPSPMTGLSGGPGSATAAAAAASSAAAAAPAVAPVSSVASAAAAASAGDNLGPVAPPGTGVTPGGPPPGASAAPSPAPVSSSPPPVSSSAPSAAPPGPPPTPLGQAGALTGGGPPPTPLGPTSAPAFAPINPKSSAGVAPPIPPALVTPDTAHALVDAQTGAYLTGMVDAGALTAMAAGLARLVAADPRFAHLTAAEVTAYRALATLTAQYTGAGWDTPLSVRVYVRPGLSDGTRLLATVFSTVDAVSIWPAGVRLPAAVLPVATLDGVDDAAARPLFGSVDTAAKLAEMVPHGYGELAAALGSTSADPRMLAAVAQADMMLPVTAERAEHRQMDVAAAAELLAGRPPTPPLAEAAAALRELRWDDEKPSEYDNALRAYHTADGRAALATTPTDAAYCAGELQALEKEEALL